MKVPTFEGTSKTFTMWWVRFNAYAVMKNFSRALVEDPALPASDSVAVADDEAKLAKKANEVAMASLTIAFKTEAMLNLVFKSMTKEWPGGLAHKVVAELKRQFQPEDIMSRVELRRSLNKLSMKEGQDPSKLFEQVYLIQNRSKVEIPEADFVAAILDSASKEYQAVLTAEQVRRGDELSVADLEDVMRKHWRTLSGNKKHQDDDNEGKEITLMNFGGTCFNCKKKGHRIKDCPDKAKGSSGNSSNTNNNSKSNSKFTGKCLNCGKQGHKAQDCWEKEENAAKRPKNWKRKPEVAAASVGASVEFICCGLSVGKETKVYNPPDGFPNTIELLKHPDIWVADSATTLHNTRHKVGMTNMRDESHGIIMGDGKEVSTSEVGDIPMTVCDRQGVQDFDIKLTEVAVNPTGPFNLFSTSKLQRLGWNLGGNADALWLTKDGKTIKFDIVVTTNKGLVFCAYLKRKVELSNAAQDQVSLTVNQAHARLGHMNEDRTRLTAKTLGWTLKSEPMVVCNGCAEGKAKQKNVPQESTLIKATKENPRVYLDISTVKDPSGDSLSKANWRIMVDERTGLKFTDFFERKSDMVEPTCQVLHSWKTAGRQVKYIRLDNAGENKKLQERAESSAWKLGLIWEFTARDTPQQNSLAEVGFALLASQGRAMMAAAHIPVELRKKGLWREAFKCATQLDALAAIEIDGIVKTRVEHWCDERPAYAKYLKTWGEAGTVKIRTPNTTKVENRGITCLFVGYAKDHAGDCYRMYNPVTSGIHESRDVVWLHRMYFPAEIPVPEPGIMPAVDLPVLQAGERVNNDQNAPEEHGHKNQNQIANAANNEAETAVGSGTVTRFGRTVKPVVRLEVDPTPGVQTYDKPVDGTEVRDLTNAEMAFYAAIGAMELRKNAEISCVGLGRIDGFADTTELHVMKFDEAMATEEAEQWQEAVDEEHERMIKNKVFEVCPRSEVAESSKVLSSTWSMKKKPNGTHRARLVARGFEQVDGDHFRSDELAAPVVNDMTIRIVFILMIMAKYCGELMDVRGAFLLGEFGKEEKLYMEVPKGFEKFYPIGVVLLLLKTIYGLKQAAYAFWRKLVEAFWAMNYERCKGDPCLYFKWVDSVLIMWMSWVDDCFVCGPDKLVKDAKEAMKKEFDCDDLGALEEYVGCKIEYNRNDGWIRFTQPVLVQSFVDEFKIDATSAPKTPAPEGQVLRKAEEADCVTGIEYTNFRKGVGKLLHLMKWSRPEIMNSVRELSRFMTSGASLAHKKAMQTVMKYVVGTPERGLLLKPEGTWDGTKNHEFVISGRSDSDHAKCPDTRKSVSGYTAFLCGAPFKYRSVMQNIVALSVTEAEEIAATECVQDMLFAMHLLESMGLKVKKPMILEVDNSGTKDIVDSWSTSGRTRHIAVKHNFLRELKEEGILQVNWIPESENTSDFFTKNVGGTKFEKCAEVLVGKDKYMTSQGESVRGN